MTASRVPSNSNGKVAIHNRRRQKDGNRAGSGAQLVEDRFGRMVVRPVTEDYIDRVMGCLAFGPDLLHRWKKEHRKEGKRWG